MFSSKDTTILVTYAANSDSFLHGFESLFGVQLVDEFVSEADSAVCCLVELVGLGQKHQQ